MKIAVIPARGGSKRIPHKNIKHFLGKPIITYPIRSAFESQQFDYVVVSTDCERIAAIARESGAEVPFKRPAELSDDQSGTTPVVSHAIDWFEHNVGEITSVCCIYPTAVFVSPDMINEGWRRLLASNKDLLVTVTEFEFPIQRAVKINEDGCLCALDPHNFNKRSQDLPRTFHDAGQMYWGRGEAFRGLSMDRNSIPMVLPRWNAQDIDTPEDWEMAEKLFSILKSNNS